MKLEHNFVVPAPVEQAWAAFNDLERVVPCFPGATLTSYDGDAFAGACKVKLGPVSLQYAGNGQFVDRDPADHRALIEAKGKDRRGNSTATVRVTARLDPSGATATAVTVETDLTITGRPAQFGRGLIEDVSNHLLAQFVTCLTTTLTTQPTTTPATPTAPPSPPTPASPAADAASTAAASTDSTGPTPPTGTSDAASSSAGTSPTAAPPPTEAPTATSSLNLGAALLPALARRARPYLIGAVLALLIRRLLRR